MTSQKRKPLSSRPDGDDDDATTKKKRHRQDHEASGSPSFTKHASSSILNKLDSNWVRLQAMLNKTQSKSHHTQMNRPNQPTNDPGVASTAPLLPKSDDCSLTKTLALDCEMVGVGPEGKRNALARVSLVNSWGNVVYDKYVRPIEHVTNLRTKISGIRARDLRKAEDFFVVQREVADLMQGRILVGHAIHYDLKVMYLSHPKKHIRDTSLYTPLRSTTGRPRALRDLCAEFLGIKIQQGEHNSVEDARAAMYVYQHFKKQWEQSLHSISKCKAGVVTME